MQWLPWERYELYTPLSVEEVSNRLSAEVEPQRMIRFKLWKPKGARMFEGTFDGKSFEIRRIIYYRNDFLPVIKGTIEKDTPGTRIVVSSRTNLFALIFMLVWMGFAGIAALVCTFLLLFGQQTDWMLLMPWAMFGFGFVLTTGAFNYENNRAKKALCRIFEATEQPKITVL